MPGLSQQALGLLLPSLTIGTIALCLTAILSWKMKVERAIKRLAFANIINTTMIVKYTNAPIDILVDRINSVENWMISEDDADNKMLQSLVMGMAKGVGS